MTNELKLDVQSRLLLIVDDERPNRKLLEVMLSAEGFLTISAASGEEALAMIRMRKPDLVILDVMMPGMDGYEVTRQMKASDASKNIPVIIITALDDREAKLRGLTAGAEEFLSKPVDRAELTVRVRNLLRLKAYGEYHDKYSQMLEGEVGVRTANLIESERLYRSTFDAAPVGIVHLGLDGQWLRVNERMCVKLGYTREELQGASVRELLESPDAPSDIEAMTSMIAKKIDRHVIEEKQYRHRDGTIVWARVYLSVHHDATGAPQHFIAVIEDITERRTLEAQLQQASKMEAVGRLASGVAHDFNNLLSVVLSYSELVAADLPADSSMRADLEEIKRAGLRAVDLTRHLLAFSRQQVLQPKVVDLADIIAGMEKMLKRLIGEDVDMSTVATKAGPILVDPGQMEQVIMNLAVNARDAMPRGGKLTIETAQIMIGTSLATDLGMKPGPHVMLTVTDTGVGMDKKTQAHMFEPFFTTKDLGKGTGLGLATVFGIVRQSGGTITVDSVVGTGTTFKVYFPTESKAVKSDSSRPAKETHSLRGTETILLVEDEERVRVLTRTILRKYGYVVLEAQSGGDAIVLAERHTAKINLLLTDVVMPLMSGSQLAERLLAMRPDMMVLYMSGYTDDAVVRHGIHHDTIAFLQKPITPEGLARKLREVLGSVHA